MVTEKESLKQTEDHSRNIDSSSSGNTDGKKSKKRIEIIDALRGLAVVLMIIHHFLYDCVEFLGGPAWLFSNPVFDILHYFFAGLFIFLSGVSSRFSRSNIKRGLIVIVVAVCITIVTYLMNMQILFGILHLLGFSMIFFGLTRKLWDIIPRKIIAFVYIILIVAGALVTRYIGIDSKYLWVLGWTYPGFISYDYFPVIPWLFVFLLGTWAGIYIVERRLPPAFYMLKVPVFPAIGRKALVVYILHQPVLYGLTMLIRFVIGIK